MLSFITLSLLSITFVTSQSTSNNTNLELEVVEANFQNAGIVPSLLAQFNPVALLDVSFNGAANVTPGQNLTVDDVKPTPQVAITPVNSSVTLGNLFTLAMVDADVVGTDESQGQTRHWLVNNVTLSSSDAVSFASAVNITDYAGPLPAAGSGPHRYVILLYTQPSTFTPPANLSSPNTPVGTYDFDSYVASTGLKGPVAGTYIQVENGVATVTLSSTAAVVTSTLPAAKSSATGSASGTASVSASSATPVKNGSSKQGVPMFMGAVFILCALFV